MWKIKQKTKQLNKHWQSNERGETVKENIENDTKKEEKEKLEKLQVVCWLSRKNISKTFLRNFVPIVWHNKSLCSLQIPTYHRTVSSNLWSIECTWNLLKWQYLRMLFFHQRWRWNCCCTSRDISGSCLCSILFTMSSWRCKIAFYKPTLLSHQLINIVVSEHVFSRVFLSRSDKCFADKRLRETIPLPDCRFVYKICVCIGITCAYPNHEISMISSVFIVFAHNWLISCYEIDIVWVWEHSSHVNWHNNCWWSLRF